MSAFSRSLYGSVEMLTSLFPSHISSLAKYVRVCLCSSPHFLSTALLLASSSSLLLSRGQHLPHLELKVFLSLLSVNKKSNVGSINIWRMTAE